MNEINIENHEKITELDLKISLDKEAIAK